jgi:hypothetical protein
MFGLRHVGILGLALTLMGLAFVGGGRTAPAPVAEENQTRHFRDALNKVIAFDGLNNPQATFGEFLDSLSERCGLTFDLNEVAFRNENVPDVYSIPVADRPLPKMPKVRVERLLRKALARIPCQSGATFLVRRDAIEITTVNAAQAEVRPGGGVNLPLAQLDYEKVPLEEVLRDLSTSNDYNILLDPRAAEKAKNLVTARLSNVSLDNAVQLLADMADLRSVQLDNVLYVTARENAVVLERELREKRNQGVPTAQTIVPVMPMPGMAGGFGGLGGLGGQFGGLAGTAVPVQLLPAPGNPQPQTAPPESK